MKYLSLEQSEWRELINLKKGSLIGYIIFFSLLLLVSFFVSEAVLPSSSDISPLSIAVIIALSYSIIFIFSNKDYLVDLIKKEKRVYRGVLSIKSIKSKSGKYMFNIDGNIFIIDKETYDLYQEGDVLDVHISACMKHLFKIEKVSQE